MKQGDGIRHRWMDSPGGSGVRRARVKMHRPVRDVAEGSRRALWVACLLRDRQR